MFAKILIANRGEIACRIIRTARRLGIKSVAVYSEADAGALHVASADEAIPIGPPPAPESYLNIERIIAAARQSGAEAIHPGYGFLSESAAFAAACEAAGIVFVGPPAAAIRAMGSKSEAKTLMQRVGVPLVPGYHGADQSEARMKQAAAEIGYPILVKASAGGGGKGMRIVASEQDLDAALASARREAEAAFGDGCLLIEKYLADPRHIEVQVFADRHGHVVHLFERDCSIQRRHQKLIEEAPAPELEDRQRQQLGALAVKAARAVSYVGAGTIEFVAAGGIFHFIEMNTRLQVEHPVTEMITGLDLVEWQLRVAAGDALPLTQNEIRRNGHAVEVRLYAEDPARGFLPAAGELELLRFPGSTPELRIETGLRQGDRITPFYDALIAKLVAWGEDRGAALHRLEAALAATKLAGLASNRDLLLRIVGDGEFVARAQDTGFIARRGADLQPRAEPPLKALAAASLALLLDRADRTAQDPNSPWRKRDFWRLANKPRWRFCFRHGERTAELTLEWDGTGYRCESGGEITTVSAKRELDGDLVLAFAGGVAKVAVLRSGAEIWTVFPDSTYRLHYVDPLAPLHRAEDSPDKILSPMPGRVSAVLVAQGDAVKRGQVLLQIEAMKMELAIVAPFDGTVERVDFAAGAQVAEGTELAVLRPLKD